MGDGFVRRTLCPVQKWGGGARSPALEREADCRGLRPTSVQPVGNGIGKAVGEQEAAIETKRCNGNDAVRALLTVTVEAMGCRMGARPAPYWPALMPRGSSMPLPDHAGCLRLPRRWTRGPRTTTDPTGGGRSEALTLPQTPRAPAVWLPVPRPPPLRAPPLRGPPPGCLFPGVTESLATVQGVRPHYLIGLKNRQTSAARSANLRYCTPQSGTSASLFFTYCYGSGGEGGRSPSLPRVSTKAAAALRRAPAVHRRTGEAGQGLGLRERDLPGPPHAIHHHKRGGAPLVQGREEGLGRQVVPQRPEVLPVAEVQPCEEGGVSVVHGPEGLAQRHHFGGHTRVVQDLRVRGGGGRGCIGRGGRRPANAQPLSP